jgi:hypothetical protein
MSNCSYYDIWKTKTGKLTEWGKKLHEYAVSFCKVGMADKELRDTSFERVEDEISDYQAQVKNQIKLAEFARKKLGIPSECPHKQVDNKSICLFHLSPSNYENHTDISHETIHKKMENKINKSISQDVSNSDSSGADSGRWFAGAKLERLTLNSQNFSPKNDKPINYSFAEIGELRIDQCSIRNKLVFDGSSIDNFICDGTQFHSPLSCKYLKIDGIELKIHNSIFDEPASFKNSKIKVVKFDLNQNIFHRKFNLDKVEVQLEYIPQSDNNTELNISNTTFERKFDFSGGTICTSEDVYGDTNIKITNCEFHNDVIWARTELDPSNEVSFNKESQAMSYDDDWGKSELDDSNQYNHDINWYINSSIFHSGANFDHVNIRGDLQIDNTEFVNGDIETGALEIYGDATFEDTSFGTGDILFNNITVDGYMSFDEVEFGSGVFKIKNSMIKKYLNLAYTNFSGEEMVLSNTNVTGSLLLNGANFHVNAGKIDMSNLTVACNANFKQSTFSATEINISGMVIKADGEWPNKHQPDQVAHDIIFKGSDWNGGAIIVGIPPTETSSEDHNRTKFEGSVAFDLANFSGQQLDFEYVLIGGDISFEYTEFNTSITSFSLSEFKGDNTVFSNTSFNSSAIMFQGIKFECRKVSFESAKFEGKLDFSPKQIENVPRANEIERKNWLSDRECVPSLVKVNIFNFSFAVTSREMRFDDTKFQECNSVKFNHMSCSNTELRFERVKNTGEPVEFRETNINSGVFLIGNNDSTIYDFTGTKIGDINIDSDGNGKLLEHFIFKDTEFNGFDFSKNKVKKHLKESGWNLHTSLLNDNQNKSYGMLSSLTSFINRSYRILRQGIDKENIHPDKLETTYMKARIGAEEQGDSDTVSRFFEKELHFRRHTYAYQFWDETDIVPLHNGGQRNGTANENNSPEGGSKSNTTDSDTGTELINESNVPDFAKDSRLLLAWKWFTNMSLYLSVGYGERASNVILTSTAVVVLFSFVHRGISALPPGSNQFDYLTYSLQGFISLIVGVQTSGSLIVRFFTSVEGFIGGFIIALFVITMTRSIDR